jgi:hypothetical protein
MFNWQNLYTVKITYFREILFHVFVILCLCKSKMHVYGKGCNRKPFKYFHIGGFYFFDNNTLAKINPTRK